MVVVNIFVRVFLQAVCDWWVIFPVSLWYQLRSDRWWHGTNINLNRILLTCSTENRIYCGLLVWNFYSFVLIIHRFLLVFLSFQPVIDFISVKSNLQTIETCCSWQEKFIYCNTFFNNKATQSAFYKTKNIIRTRKYMDQSFMLYFLLNKTFELSSLLVDNSAGKERKIIKSWWYIKFLL